MSSPDFSLIEGGSHQNIAQMRRADPQARYAVESDEWGPIYTDREREVGLDRSGEGQTSYGTLSDYEDDIDRHNFALLNDAGVAHEPFGKPEYGTWERKYRRYCGDPRRIRYYLPIFAWLPKYSLYDLPSDLLAGLAVVMLLVPQGIAYAIIAGFPPNYGLYAGIVPLLMYVIFGTCPQLAVGPEGVISLLLAEFVQEIQEEEPGLDVEELLTGYIFGLSFLVGLTCLLLGLFRAGFFTNIVSKPILAGFISASALIIMGSQFDQLFGFSSDDQTSICNKSPSEGLRTYVLSIKKLSDGCANWWAFLIGCVSILFFFGIEQLKRHFSKKIPKLSLLPTTFLIIVLGIGLGASVDLEECCNVNLLGKVDSGLPPFSYPKMFSIEKLQLLVSQLPILVLVGFIEATAVAKMYGSKHHYSVSPNRELIAFGMCNLVGSFFSAYPVFSSLPRSRIADLAGARTTISGLVAALICALSALFVMPLFQYLPMAVVAGVIVCAALLLIEYEEIYEMVIIGAYLEFALALVIFVVTLGLGPSFGILLALIVSVIMIVKRSTSLEIMMLTPAGEDVGPELRERRLDDNITILRVDEPLHFGNAVHLKEIVGRIEVFGSPHVHPSAEKSRSPLCGFIFHMKNVNTIDAEAVSTLREIISDFVGRAISIYFVQLQEQPLDFMRRGHLLGGEHGLIGEECLFDSLQVAMEKMRKEVETLLELRHEFVVMDVSLQDGEMGDMSGTELPPRERDSRRGRRDEDGMFEEGISFTFSADTVTAKSHVD